MVPGRRPIRNRFWRPEAYAAGPRSGFQPLTPFYFCAAAERRSEFYLMLVRDTGLGDLACERLHLHADLRAPTLLYPDEQGGGSGLQVGC